MSTTTDREPRDWLAAPLGRRAALRGAALGVSGIAAAALIGCGDDEDESKPPAVGTSEAATATAAAGDPRYPRDPDLPYAYNFPEPAGKTPKAGGMLTVAATWDVGPMDPTKSAAGGTIVVPNLVYNRLIGINGGPEVKPFKLELKPELAKSWEFSPDGLVFTATIDPRVKWQNIAPLNGRPFVAMDAKLAFERYAKEGVHQSYWVNVDKIETPDPQTLRVTLKKPTPEFEVPLATRYQTIFPPELVDSGEIDKKVVGTGPMILTAATPSAKVLLRKNPDYWRTKVLLDGAEFRMTPDASARVAAFRANQVDYAYSVASSKRDLDELAKSIPGLQVNIPPTVSATIPFAMNLSNPKFQDVRVRRALSLAMNRPELVSLVYEGLGKSSLVIPWIYLFDREPTDNGPWIRADVGEAKKQLQAAGQEDFSFDFIYFPYSASLDRISEVLINQFRMAGITMKGGKVDYTSFNSQWVGAKLPEASTSGWITVGSDANTYFYNHIHSKSPGNRWQLKDPQMDEWAEQQAVELNVAKRRETQKKIWDREVDQVFRPPMVDGYSFEVYQPWLRGIRFGAILAANSSYYDWGHQIEGAWLDK